jgi:hypothetical protein
MYSSYDHSFFALLMSGDRPKGIRRCKPETPAPRTPSITTVLIGGKKILAVGRNLNATASVVDASGMIVMPGFIDTHHHQYETILRGILADGVLGSPNDGKKTYQGVIQGIFTPVYQPEDAYISELVASLPGFHAKICSIFARNGSGSGVLSCPDPTRGLS